MTMKKLAQLILTATVTCTVSLSASAHQSHTGPFGFEPITESANTDDYDKEAPWKLPEGFSQAIVSGETDLNIYPDGLDDWHDMNTTNESGKHAGRYLYRTHEVRLRSGGIPDDVYPEGGAVSVVDLHTGKTEVLAQDPTFTALDGIIWTPWDTLLFAEETTEGRLFEIILDPKNPMKVAEIIDRPAVGRLAHEGIEIDAQGNVYIVDEFRGQIEGEGGGIYKFVPDTYGDLSSGELFVLAVDGTGDYATGQGSWVGPINPEIARQSGTEAGGEGYNRPEDLEIIDNVLYVAITEGPRFEDTNGSGTITSSDKEEFEGRVIAINLDSMNVTNFITPENVGGIAPVEVGKPGVEGHQTGWDSVDNLGVTPDGKLMIIEDNKPSDIWIADKDHNNDGIADDVWLFGSLTDPAAEGTGIYFGKNPKVLFVNVQHSVEADGDATWAIIKD